ncbi:acetyl-CoA acyltransferase [Thermosporothrix hazakensis]|jgi:acetyl-CoA acetyltransferase family protein|uniref:acetyl-CoA C-acyltransferase n=1 Tax=Thermosporothrix hazakensis TaxID=644383 RepID=A0A326U3L9_THEHA|nr:thiolase family protein [Thermosporothrix hazakensis]PZW26695.1 acetyl-CoA acyltransferase [Thermosporothrix hazakensis]GCE47604.1 acetyl-CoA acetyltransferase [Thermosporothrix hazakensis]
MAEAVIVSAVRTPIGRANKGVLKDVRADDLAAIAVKAAVERVPALDPALIEDVILGCAFPEGEQGMNLARIVTALAGLPETTGGVTVNRFCASSLQAVNMAAQSIMLGLGDVVIAGGVENMSRVPMGGFNPSFNPRLVSPREGERISSPYPPCELEYGYASYMPMGITAENLAKQYQISREEQDAFALRSHQRAIAATDQGIFKREIVPVPLPDGRVMEIDEGPRRDTSMEKLATLESAFLKGGTVTAGNSSPLNDGAAAVVLMSAEKAQELGITPLAKVRTMAVAGVRPDIMGIGPVPAVRKLLQRAGLQLSDIDVIELNEAFAAQSLSVVRELGIDDEKLNPHGGAIALGHPLGCSGARLIATLINDLQTLDKTLGIATLCVGGGQGLATLIERMS